MILLLDYTNIYAVLECDKGAQYSNNCIIKIDTIKGGG